MSEPVVLWMDMEETSERDLALASLFSDGANTDGGARSLGDICGSLGLDDRYVQ